MRRAECDLIDGALERARTGQPNTVTLTGLPGSGKSWLVDYAAGRGRDEGFALLHAGGSADDAELAFGGLQLLLRRVEDLAGLQNGSDVLSRAMTLGAADVDALSVRVAFFELVVSLAERGGVLLCIDDVDLLDRATADVLAFTLRRLGADAVAAVVTARSAPAWLAKAAHPLSPLPVEAAARIVEEHGVAAEPAQQCARAAQGNPAVALALADALTPDQRSGRVPMPAVPRPAEALLRHAIAQIDALDEHARRALTVVAADHRGDVAAVRSALALLGEPADALDDAEAAGAVQIDGASVVFTDPWLRPAAYHALAPASRRAAHRSLAESYAQPHEAADRAWQLVAAANGPSDAVASALELVSVDMARRGGPRSAAHTLERAAGAAASDALRRRLTIAASERWLDAGDPAEAARVARTLVATTTAELAAAVDPIELADGPRAALAFLDASPVIDAELRAQLVAADRGGDPAPVTDATPPRRRRRLERLASARAGDHRSLARTPTEDSDPADHLASALALRHAGRLPESREALLRVEALLAPTPSLLGVHHVLQQADLDVLAGRRDDARERLTAIAPAVAVRGDAEARAVLAWLQARVAGELGTVVVAPPTPVWAIRRTISGGCAADLAAAVDAATAADLPIEAGEARLALAEAAARAGRVDDAAAAASLAAATLGRCSVRGWSERLERAVPAAPVARPTTSALAELSAAEARVAEAVGAGMTNREAAATLFLSVKTVDFHLQQIYRKLGLRSRTELAVVVAGGTRAEAAR